MNVTVKLSEIQEELISAQIKITEITHILNLFLRASDGGLIPDQIEIPEEYLSINVGNAETKAEYAAGC